MAKHKSAIKEEPAVRGENTAGGIGLSGISEQGRGVEGRSTKGVGVVGLSEDYRGIEGRSTNEHAIFGRSTKGAGVVGISEDNRGVHGRSTNEHGVFGESTKGAGVAGFSKSYRGVHGRSEEGQGVWGTSVSSIGVAGVSDTGPGVQGVSTGGVGVTGESKSERAGVFGTSEKGPGVWGVSEAHEGVHAESKSKNTAALAAYQLNPASDQPAFFAKHAGNRRAARFEGDAEVTGKLTVVQDILLSNADCAEDFNVSPDVTVEPGTVMVLVEEDTLFPSQRAYDKRVAGVISGAGHFRPGIVLDKQEALPDRHPIALLGKVYCKVDAQYGAIDVGDLLTTSPTSGYAMRATDPVKSFGAVIGKALRPLREGQALIPILIALQ
jgi:hypothetical protein